MVDVPVIRGMKVDHVGLTTPDIDAALAKVVDTCAADVLRAPMDNIERGVRQAFVRVEGGLTLELLSPLQGMVSPIAQHVRSGGGAHHICFATEDLAGAVRAAQQLGARIVVAPTPDAAFDGRSIAFLVDPLYGLTEFLEADLSGRSRTELAGNKSLGRDEISHTLTTRGDLDGALAQVLVELFPSLGTTGVASARLEATPGWDSLGHIRLIIALEQRLGITIPSDAIARLLNYEAIRSFVRAGI